MREERRIHLESLRALDTVRREGASVGGERAVVKGVAIAARDDGAVLRGKRIDQRDHHGDDLLSVLRREETPQTRTATPKRPPSSTVPAWKKSLWQ